MIPEEIKRQSDDAVDAFFEFVQEFSIRHQDYDGIAILSGLTAALWGLYQANNVPMAAAIDALYSNVGRDLCAEMMMLREPENN